LFFLSSHPEGKRQGSDASFLRRNLEDVDFDDGSDYLQFVVVLCFFVFMGFFLGGGFKIKNSGEVANRLNNTSNKIEMCHFSSMPRKARRRPYLLVLHYPLSCSQFHEQNHNCEKRLTILGSDFFSNHASHFLS